MSDKFVSSYKVHILEEGRVSGRLAGEGSRPLSQGEEAKRKTDKRHDH